MKGIITALALMAATLHVNAEMVRFTADIQNDRVVISWYGIALHDDYTYVVQRSKDGAIFKDISILHAGSTEEYVEFFDVDTKPMKGISLYRVKQVGKLGEEKFSEIVVVRNMKTKKTGRNTAMINDVLVIVENPAGEEFYGKVFVNETRPHLKAKDLEGNMPTGLYRIVATSDDTIRNLFIAID